MFTIQTLNKISAVGLAQLDAAKYTCTDAADAPDGVLVRSAAMHDMTLPSSLLAIARAGAGVNNIPVDRCTEQGVVVFNTPGANANAVKELVIAGLLLSSRKIVAGCNWAAGLAGQGDVAKLVEKGKSSFVGPEIAGKKLGVIGLGAIGVLVANAATHLNMEVYGYDPYLSVHHAWSLSRSVKPAKSADEIFAACDYITIHVPLTSETKHMVNAASIAKMKDGVRILNFARGDLVADDDILTAVQSGRVGCYVTDFPNEKLIGVDGVIAIPHLGASTPESEENCAEMAAQELAAYLEDGNIRNSVNFPDAELPRSAGTTRVCIMHQNIPQMLNRITQVFAEQNIAHLLNKSRKDIAYTLIDLDGAVSASLLDQIEQAEGVLRVRVLAAQA